MDRKTTLETIIAKEDLTVVFQPIFINGEKQPYGYEALIRGPVETPLYSPVELFELAVEVGYLSELELVCRRKSIEQFVALNLPGKLFLNISPMVFLQSDHPKGKTLSFLARHKLKPEQVVIEISEKYPIETNDVLKSALMHYRDLGFNIAVDDLGAGYSGLKLWSEVKPDYVKIDRYFINECHLDPVKKAFIKCILDLGNSINTTVIAEGIETNEEHSLLDELGINIYQGFLFAKPASIPNRFVPRLLANKSTNQNNTQYNTQYNKLSYWG